MTAQQATCESVLRGISAYLDGELARTDCDVIERHCQACEPCAKVVESLRATIGLCRAAAAVPIPDAVRQKAQASVKELLRTAPKGTA
jgi:anti-sigma factor RsiW